jgi:hypothetical protein
MRTLLIVTGLILGALSPAVSHADFRRVCRAASLYKYDDEIKSAVKKSLHDAHIAFKRVNIEYTQIQRPKSKYINDFASDLTVNGGATPSVSFTGQFPNLPTCTIDLNVRITVVYPDGAKSITVNPTTAPGVLLFPLGPKRQKSDD